MFYLEAFSNESHEREPSMVPPRVHGFRGQELFRKAKMEIDAGKGHQDDRRSMIEQEGVCLIQSEEASLGN